MNTHANKTQDNKSKSIANAVAQKKDNQAVAFEDNRPKSVTQKKSKTVDSNSTVAQLGKKKDAIKKAKTNNPNGVQHHIRPEYQEENERQMELIRSGVDRKEARRQAREEKKNS